MHPPLPITYGAAHRRVRDERGPASLHACTDCGERAAEWSYSGLSPDEQLGAVGPEQEIRAWSPIPSDYDPRCLACHWSFDESGVVFGVGPASTRISNPPVPLGLPPSDAPAWVCEIAEIADWRRMLRA